MPGTADGLSVDGDDPTIVDGGGLHSHAGAEDTVGQVRVDVGHMSASDRGFRRLLVQVNAEFTDGGVGRVIDLLRNRQEGLCPGVERGESDGEQGGHSMVDTKGAR